MENASKALIIAGAILLAILLISLGIMIYSQAQDTVSDSGMDQAAVTSFNNQFLKYEGNIKGTLVKAMIQEVLAVNEKKDSNDGYTVKVGINGATATATDISTSSISNNKTYSVKLSYNGAGGRVDQITVQDTNEEDDGT